MKTNKILLNISNIKDIEKYKKLGITNFLFPLRDYCVGYSDFTFDDIKNISGNVYVLINRLLTDEDIDNFEDMHIPNNVKGFIIEDIGMLSYLKSKGYEVILFENHLNNNYETVNIMLRDVDSLVISSDITLEEINKIIKESTKSLVLNTFFKPMVMYSRRRLVSNYDRFYGKAFEDTLEIKDETFNKIFDLVENKWGTSVFNKEFVDYRKALSDIEDSKIKYYLIDTNFIDYNIVKNVIDGKDIENTSEGFLYTKTFYKVGDKK